MALDEASELAEFDECAKVDYDDLEDDFFEELSDDLEIDTNELR